MTTGYNVSGVGDLDALFAPRVSAAAANTNFKNNGGVDLAQRFEPRGATTAIANTNFKSGSTDLAQIFKGIAANTITITDQVYETTRVLPSSASVGYTLENDGDVIRTINAVPTDVGDWIVPKASAPGSYECRATKLSGVNPTSGSALATWLALTSLQSWGLARNTLGSSTCVLLIEIRLGGTTLGSCQVTFTVTCET